MKYVPQIFNNHNRDYKSVSFENMDKYLKKYCECIYIDRTESIKPKLFFGNILLNTTWHRFSCTKAFSYVINI